MTVLVESVVFAYIAPSRIRISVERQGRGPGHSQSRGWAAGRDSLELPSWAQERADSSAVRAAATRAASGDDKVFRLFFFVMVAALVFVAFGPSVLLYPVPRSTTLHDGKSCGNLQPRGIWEGGAWGRECEFVGCGLLGGSWLGDIHLLLMRQDGGKADTWQADDKWARSFSGWLHGVVWKSAAKGPLGSPCKPPSGVRWWWWCSSASCLRPVRVCV